MNKITVVCHKDHDNGYEDYAGKCLLCEVERLQKREWVGLTEEDFENNVSIEIGVNGSVFNSRKFAKQIEQILKEKNHAD